MPVETANGTAHAAASHKDRIFALYRKPGGLERPTREIADEVGCDPGHVTRVRRQWDALGVEVREVAIADLDIMAGTQLRKAIDQDTVKDYAELWRLGEADFPPPVVVDEDGRLILAHGFHRTLGAQAAGLESIVCEVHKGDRALAMEIAARANAEQKGLRQTRADVRHKIMRLLDDPAWHARSDHDLGHTVGVDPKTVKKYRAEHDNPAPKPGIPGESACSEGGDDGGRGDVDGDRPAGVSADVPDRVSGGNIPDGVVVEEVAGQAPADDLETWLNTLEVRDHLDRRTRAIFDADAAFYRDFLEAVSPLKNAAIAHATRMEQVPAWGAFYARVQAVLKLPHPRGGQRKGDRHASGWLACADCRNLKGLSTGLVPDNGHLKCQSCSGRGYHIGGGK